MSSVTKKNNKKIKIKEENHLFGQSALKAVISDLNKIL